MTMWHAFILSLIQGITEFLPISSSGHLVIAREILDWPDSGVAFDAFTGLGTLTAVIIYYRKDICEILRHWFGQFSHHKAPDPEHYARLGNQLIVATLPALIIGFLIKDYVNSMLHSPLIIAGATLVFGILLGASDLFGKKDLPMKSTTMRQAIVYGIFQAVALIPGVSRSGITMTAGLMMGFTRQAAARFSFLLSIPISAAAGGYGLLQLIKAPSDDFSLSIIVFSYFVSLISAYFCIAIFLRFLNLVGMWPNVIYRIVLGSFLLWYFL